jgi:phosphoribosylamine--glycine ligase
LAAGKGVVICKTNNEVIKFSKEILKGKFTSSRKLILEEFLEGEEASYFVIVDEKNFSFMGSAQDHKKVGEKETGLNTGGMGAYSPAPIIDNKIENKVINKIIKPTLKALKDKKKPFTGFLYAGLMIKNNEPYLIEYNIRMGDPECQVILPRLETDLIKIINASLNNSLNKINIKWKKEKCMTIVLCSKGYPGKYKKGERIVNLEKIKSSKNNFIFHAGTDMKDNMLVSNGGRVLNITALGLQFLKIRERILKTIKTINWKKGFFRKDIGWRVI